MTEECRRRGRCVEGEGRIAAKYVVVSTPPKRSELTPSGMLIEGACVVGVAGRGRGVAEPEVGHVDRLQAVAEPPRTSDADAESR